MNIKINIFIFNNKLYYNKNINKLKTKEFKVILKKLNIK